MTTTESTKNENENDDFSGLFDLVAKMNHKKKKRFVKALHEHVAKARSSTLFPGFSGNIVYMHDKEYQKSRQQYATTSFPKVQMSPFAILYCQNVDDVKIAISGAIKGEYKVLARSGGHQYCGLSSGNNGVIQLDMSAFDNKSYDKDKNLLTIGVGNNLRKVTNYLDENGVTLPSGQCYKVGIGGHVQTGGWGNILRSFGLTVDYICGFDIVLSNGDVRSINKTDELEKQLEESAKKTYSKDEDTKEEEVNNADIFWAVLGGNPNSFGIVTEWRFNPIKNSDHPKSYGGNLFWFWNKKTYKQILKVMKSYADNENFPSDYDFMVTCGMREFGELTFRVIWLNMLYGDKKGGVKPNMKYFDNFKKIGNPLPSAEFGIQKPDYYPISHMMRKLFRVNSKREYDFPYIKSLYGTFDTFTEDFIKDYAKKIDEVLGENPHETGEWFIGQFQIGGGATVANDPNSIYTAISRRHCKVGMTNDIFYDPKIKKSHESALEWHNDLGLNFIAKKDFWSKTGQDIRFTWGTFGEVNINKVWQFYYDNEQKYIRLNRIKTVVDKINLFHNSFTIPGYY